MFGSTRGKAVRGNLRARIIPFVLALTAAAFASVLVAPAASAHTGRVKLITCNTVVLRYKRFTPGTNSVDETVTIDGSTAVSKTFTFTGPDATDTIPVGMAPGIHTVTVSSQWTVRKVSKSVTATAVLTCGGNG
jgi:hypothetical protein